MSKVLLDPLQIAVIEEGIAEKLNEKYQFVPREAAPVFCPILQGSVPFFNSLMSMVMFDPYIEYIGVRSYNGKTQGDMDLYKFIDTIDVVGRDVWLFDDIADSGNTLAFLERLLLRMGAQNVYSCTLLKRKTCRYDVTIVGKDIDDEWVFGYGMDDEGWCRGECAIFAKADIADVGEENSQEEPLD